MRTMFLPLVIATTVFTLAACSDNRTDTQKPSLNDVTSHQSVEAAKQVVLQQSRPKADKSVPWDSYIVLNSGNQLMYRYLGLAGLPVDYRDLAAQVSKEYSRSNDEFHKNDLLTALQPQIDTAIAQAKARPYFKIEVSQPISKYDFERHGFPVDSSLWEAGSYRYFYDNSAYRLSFTNGDGYRYLNNIPEDAARNIERLRNVYKGLHMVVYGFAHSADTSNNTVQADIVKVDLVDSKGNVLASQ